MTSQKKTDKRIPAGWNFAALLAALLVCAVLGIAAFSKISDPNKAKFITLGGTSFEYDRWIGFFEVLVILALLAGHRLRAAWLGVLVMFSAFSGYAAFYLVSGKSCGCFGNALDGTPLEWMTAKGVSLGFDILFVLIALGLLAWRRVGFHLDDLDAQTLDRDPAAKRVAVVVSKDSGCECLWFTLAQHAHVEELV